MRRAKPWWILLCVLAIFLGVWAGRWVVNAQADALSAQTTTTSWSADSGQHPHSAEGTGKRHPVHINFPDGPPRIDTGQVDEFGRPVTVSCASCHANLEPNHAVRSGADLTTFHQGLRFNHGDLSCLSCHNPQNYNTLRLADGSSIDYRDLHNMCAQCHAPQARDYEHGAHGGMIGYWDLSRGARTRHGCIDCHDPHSPEFPSMVPTFKPLDRFLPGPERATEYPDG